MPPLLLSFLSARRHYYMRGAMVITTAIVFKRYIIIIYAPPWYAAFSAFLMLLQPFAFSAEIRGLIDIMIYAIIMRATLFTFS